MNILTNSHGKLNASRRIKSYKDVLELGTVVRSVSGFLRRAAVGLDALDHIYGSVDGRLQATNSDHGDRGEKLPGVCLPHLILPASAGIDCTWLRAHDRKTPVLSCKR